MVVAKDERTEMTTLGERCMKNLCYALAVRV